MTELATYSRFYSREEAEPMLQLLNDSGIPYEINLERNALDNIYFGENPDPMFSLRIPASDFEKVNALVDANTQPEISEVDPEYYLLQFSNEELKAVVQQPAEWNRFDQVLAKKILAQRHVEIPTTGILWQEAYTPIRLAPIWVGMEILISIFFSFAGIIIGLATIVATKTLPNGTKVKIYDEVTHTNAKLIIIIGVIRTLYYFYMVLG